MDLTDAHVDGGRVRSVRFDRHHDRFQTLEADCADRGTGIGKGVLVLGLDGDVRQRTLFSRDEIHLLELSPEAELVYTVGRQGVLYVLDNASENPRVAKTITGFPHEATSMAMNEQGSVYVLMLSNELVKLDVFGECVDGFAPARRQGIWDLQPDLERPDRWYCATDEGVAVIDVEFAAIGGPVLRPVEHHRTRYGMPHRLVTMPDGYVGLAHDQTVFRSYSDGKLLWRVRIDDRGLGLAVGADYRRVLIASGIGGLELESRSTSRWRTSPWTVCPFGPRRTVRAGDASSATATVWSARSPRTPARGYGGSRWATSGIASGEKAAASTRPARWASRRSTWRAPGRRGRGRAPG